MRTRHADLLLLLATLVAGQPSAPEQHATFAPTTTASTAYGPPTTCESRAINYLTHTLPQQCLDTAVWSAASRSTQGTHAQTPDASLSSQHTAGGISTDNPSPTPDTPTANPQPSETQAPSDASRPTTPLASSESASPLPDAETESVLDNAQFLSFEEWKRQKVPEKQEHPRKTSATAKRHRPGANQALEGFGDEAEIEIDFAGFRATGDPKNSQRPQQPSNFAHDGAHDAEHTEDKGELPTVRSKDAGKTCKERFNYASFDCAATVLKTNDKVKHASSILVENKDTYMTSECSVDNKFIIVELCEDVLIDTVVLANYEWFASSFHTFRVSASETYPVRLDKWKTLGTFEAKNSREIQPFLIENPQIFARYLRIEFLTHYGNQYYCPMSLLRVHGMTMFAQWKLEQIESPAGAGAVDQAEDELAVVSEIDATPPESSPEQPQEPLSNNGTSSDKLDMNRSPQFEQAPAWNASQDATAANNEPAETGELTSVCSPTLPALGLTSPHSTSSECPSSAIVTAAPDNHTASASTNSSNASVGIASQSSVLAQDIKATGPLSSRSPATSATSSGTLGAMTSNTTTTESITADPSSSSTSTPSASATPSSIKSPPSAVMSPSPAASAAVSASSAASVPVPPGAPAAPSAPATQESFFKSIHKRLQALESNSTLSMEYIESQSQILREAFAKIDKRNIAKTSEFLERLNSTVIAELSRFKSDYEQLWQSTVLELASQRDEGRREREILSEQVKLLAGEVVSQKRLQAAQATLLLLCLVFVIFGRGGAVVDTALIQNVQGFVAKQRRRRDSKADSISRKWPWESPWMSPPATRPVSRRGHQHTSSVELDVGDAAESPAALDSSEDGDALAASQRRVGDEAPQGGGGATVAAAAAARMGCDQSAARLMTVLETHSAPTTPRREHDQLDLDIDRHDTGDEY